MYCSTIIYIIYFIIYNMCVRHRGLVAEIMHDVGNFFFCIVDFIVHNIDDIIYFVLKIHV
jgi:hypothetical protein